ncbi:MAG: hypothetical protein PW789_08960 [Edaphobacter sp.]|uniref:hypothetical protein n=1 Tax=Edaphobacter sp. TaxID=1934404 RepID=UPI00239C04C1|nr:hypothetical protein [Edaphobacter sp.]MDE1176726.1 hypothetical protein [Edaphobacter sp.]
MADALCNAARRALDALLRTAHRRTVLLRLPAPAAPLDAEQLGLSTPLFQDVPLTPAIFRKTYTGAAEQGHATRELLLSATTVDALTGSHQFDSADALFASAFGVLVDQTLLSITAVDAVQAGGIACGYRLALREPIVDI